MQRICINLITSNYYHQDRLGSSVIISYRDLRIHITVVTVLFLFACTVRVGIRCWNMPLTATIENGELRRVSAAPETESQVQTSVSNSPRSSVSAGMYCT